MSTQKKEHLQMEKVLDKRESLENARKQDLISQLEMQKERQHSQMKKIIFKNILDDE